MAQLALSTKHKLDLTEQNIALERFKIYFLRKNMRNNDSESENKERVSEIYCFVMVRTG